MSNIVEEILNGVRPLFANTRDGIITVRTINNVLTTTLSRT